MLDPAGDSIFDAAFPRQVCLYLAGYVHTSFVSLRNLKNVSLARTFRPTMLL